MSEIEIPLTFLSKAADTLADTNSGLSGTQIVRVINGYGDRWGVKVPHPNYPWEAPNKRTALYDSLRVFSASQQFTIIEELCQHHFFAVGAPSTKDRERLRIELFSRFGGVRSNQESRELDNSLIDEARHWLSNHQKSLDLLNQAKIKYDAKIFQRSLIDDLRLSLEILLKEILDNSKSLENQLSIIGDRLKKNGSSSQFVNMFQKLLDLYCKYQNDYIKHDDKVQEEEIEFIFEITASFMKHIVRVAA